MKKILIIYFSGVGATKRVAKLVHTQLSKTCEVALFSLESKNSLIINNYDAVVIGMPVYHCKPPKIVTKYIENLPRLRKEMPTFIFNTRGLYSANTNRILSKQLQTKNIITVMDRAYRSPASDGSIIAPFVKRFFEFEKNLGKKIIHDCLNFLDLLDKEVLLHGYIPRFKFESILNAPNKIIGLLITRKIHLHKNSCVKCSLCIEQCPYMAFSANKEGYPLFDDTNCENCYRCIHHCPKMALSLSKRKKPKKLLRYENIKN